MTLSRYQNQSRTEVVADEAISDLLNSKCGRDVDVPPRGQSADAVPIHQINFIPNKPVPPMLLSRQVASTRDAAVWFWTKVWTWTFRNWTEVQFKVRRQRRTGPQVVLFRPGLAWKPWLWPGLRWLWLSQTPGQAKAIKHGLALAWPGLGQGFLVYV